MSAYNKDRMFVRLMLTVVLLLTEALMSVWAVNTESFVTTTYVISDSVSTFMLTRT